VSSCDKIRLRTRARNDQSRSGGGGRETLPAGRGVVPRLGCHGSRPFMGRSAAGGGPYLRREGYGPLLSRQSFGLGGRRPICNGERSRSSPADGRRAIAKVIISRDQGNGRSPQPRSLGGRTRRWARQLRRHHAVLPEGPADRPPGTEPRRTFLPQPTAGGLSSARSRETGRGRQQ